MGDNHQIFHHRSNYFLFVMNIFTVFIIAWLPLKWQANLYNGALVVLFIACAMVLSHQKEKKYYVAILILIFLSLLSRVLKLELLGAINFFLSVFFYGYVVIQLIRKVAVAKTVTKHVIVGSINGYLLFGILLSIVIAIVEKLAPGSFDMAVKGENNGLYSGFEQYIYYGFVTLTTLGYGDYLPNTPGTRAVSIFMSVSGQMYIGIIIALLVGKFSNTKIEE